MLYYFSTGFLMRPHAPIICACLFWLSVAMRLIDRNAMISDAKSYLPNRDREPFSHISSPLRLPFLIIDLGPKFCMGTFHCLRNRFVCFLAPFEWQREENEKYHVPSRAGIQVRFGPRH